MSSPLTESVLHNQEPSAKSFLGEVLAGLNQYPKTLPCKYFYDKRGSELFDQICELEEYYLTRTEMAIMENCVTAMAEQIGPRVMLVEYGSGSSVKTQFLLDHLNDPAAYVAVDISRKHLQSTCREIALSYPGLEVLPVCADFTTDFKLPTSRCNPSHAAVYFPGSTIGNFEPEEALELLSRFANLCGTGGGLLIGIDLEKEPSRLEAAYNDSQGVTADFNLNLLLRINRELEGDFCLEQFRHVAKYNFEQSRIEIYLQSLCNQVVSIAGNEIYLTADELIRTELSHKYTIERFAKLCEMAGLTLRKSWTDPENLFAVLHFVVLQ